jgi:hypothetical protein
MHATGCLKFQAVQRSFRCAATTADLLSDVLAEPICKRLQSRAWTPLKGPLQSTLSCKTLAWLVEAIAMQQARLGFSM